MGKVLKGFADDDEGWGNLWKRGGVLPVIRLMNKQNVLDINVIFLFLDGLRVKSLFLQ